MHPITHSHTLVHSHDVPTYTYAFTHISCSTHSHNIHPLSCTYICFHIPHTLTCHRTPLPTHTLYINTMHPLVHTFSHIPGNPYVTYTHTSSHIMHHSHIYQHTHIHTLTHTLTTHKYTYAACTHMYITRTSSPHKITHPSPYTFTSAHRPHMCAHTHPSVTPIVLTAQVSAPPCSQPIHPGRPGSRNDLQQCHLVGAGDWLASEVPRNSCP